MPHAYLFAGPAGVGRRTTAVAFAKTLLCENPTPSRQACGTCSSCRMAAAGTHPDLQLIYKELAAYHDNADIRNRVMQQLGIAVIRSFLIAPAGRSAAHGRGKVFVVLDAELLSIAAQNAMLKTLEEPPAGVTIILICRQPERLLATTLSRCAMVRFRPLPSDFVRGRLIDAGVKEPEARFWSAYTEGSLGLALRLEQSGMYEIKCDLLKRLSGPTDDAELSEHLKKTADNLATAAVNASKKAEGSTLSKALASRRAAGTMLQLIASAYRDAITIAAGVDRPLAHSDQQTEIRILADRFEPAKLAAVIEQLSAYERLLWRNVNPRIIWDNVVITCDSAAALRL